MASDDKLGPSVELGAFSDQIEEASKALEGLAGLLPSNYQADECRGVLRSTETLLRLARRSGVEAWRAEEAY